jgi:hypothetical protein
MLGGYVKVFPYVALLSVLGIILALVLLKPPTIVASPAPTPSEMEKSST